MKNKMIIVQMKDLCKCPKPERKKEFFERLEKEGLPRRQPAVMSQGEFLICQLFYIEKWLWLLSGALLLFLIWGCSRNAGNYPFALTPLLAGGMLAETERSRRWKMDELECAARFSLRSILLTRMFLVGLVNTVGLLVVILVIRPFLAYSLPRVFLYMMVPYLTASFLGSLYERKNRRDAGVGSLVICILSSAVYAAAPRFFSYLYEKSFTILWAAAFILLAGSFAFSMREYIHEMEDMVWNS